MESDIGTAKAFIEQFVEKADPVWTALSWARWKLATTGEESCKEEVVALRREEHSLYEGEGHWQQIGELYEAREEFPAPLKRQVEILHRYYLTNQSTAEENAALAQLEADVNEIFIKHRAVVDGRTVSDNEINEILKTSSDEKARRQAWQGSKEVGAKSAPLIRELARRRNAIARRLGFRDHYDFALQRQEIDEAELLALFDRLASLTDEPFRRVKEQIDERLRRRLQLPPGTALAPWHYGDPFFQEVPAVFDANLDLFFEDVDIAVLSIEAYHGMGMDVRDILGRSDLYEREGKDQHAFCTRIGREGDTRILCNLRPNARWMTTQMHELGHAVYNKYLPLSLPYLLRTPAHTNSTEAIAMLMGRLPRNPRWLVDVAGQDAATVRRIEDELERELAAAQLIFVRWVLVMLHFERALYADPEREDLNDLWWELVGEYQSVPRPQENENPHWAAKYHLALAPVYYHNYVLGELTASQLEHWIAGEVGSAINKRATGELLVDRFFAHGAQHPWDTLIEVATGEPLRPEYFVEQFVNAQKQ